MKCIQCLHRPMVGVNQPTGMTDGVTVLLYCKGLSNENNRKLPQAATVDLTSATTLSLHCTNSVNFSINDTEVHAGTTWLRAYVWLDFSNMQLVVRVHRGQIPQPIDPCSDPGCALPITL